MYNGAWYNLFVFATLVLMLPHLNILTTCKQAARYLIPWVCAMFILCNTGQGQSTRISKLQALYDSLVEYDIEHAKTVVAVAILETGWMECTNCTYRYNNLFGFRNSKGYIHFKNISACLAYLKKWQTSFYSPWIEKNPTLTYYDFLAHIKYAKNMPAYIKMIKHLEGWVAANIELRKADKKEKPD